MFPRLCRLLQRGRLSGPRACQSPSLGLGRFLNTGSVSCNSTATPEDEILDSYDFDLPEESIAVNPVVPRHASRLLCVESRGTHRHMADFLSIHTLLRPHDLLIFNDTRVISARMFARLVESPTITTIKAGDGKDNSPKTAEKKEHTQQRSANEVFLLEPRGENTWLAMFRKAKRVRVGSVIEFVKESQPDLPKLYGRILDVDDTMGCRVVRFESADVQSGQMADLIHHYGEVPLPPYIKNSTADPSQYQTIYSKKEGAVAAPTAGLHFTDDVFKLLKEKGVNTEFLTLHVGIGTFKPVKVTNIKEHDMHAEYAEVTEKVVSAIKSAKEKGGRVFAVGTTTARALEAVASANNGSIVPHTGKVNIFIYPGYKWKVLDGLITNFHLPKSTLLMMVSSLIGRTRLLNLYKEAVDLKYRFFSFGDAMVIMPDSRIDKEATSASQQTNK